jgi:hypothetical protein
MVVDYKLKTMEVTSAGQKVKLQGVVDDISSCPPITQKKLAGLLRRGAVSHCIQMTVPTMEEWIPSVCSIEDSETADIPSAVSELIQQFDHLLLSLRHCLLEELQITIFLLYQGHDQSR